MHRDRDFSPDAALPSNADALIQDLELETLLNAMAQGDELLFACGKAGLLSTLPDPAAIVYRQRVLADCLAREEVVRDIYDLAVEAIRGERRVYLGMLMRDSPDAILSRSGQVLDFFAGVLKRLRQIADERADGFQSEGFVQFFAMLRRELDDEYLGAVDRHLKELRFHRGVLMSAELGTGNKGRRYALRLPQRQSLLQRIGRGRSNDSFTIPDRDENGLRALADLRGRGINLVANALAQSTDHILGFFTALRSELAFYIGCLNLRAQLDEKGVPTCVPAPLPARDPAFSASGLYDPSLALHLEGRVVGNDVEADGRSLVIITGANQGGKSTFLRSVGVAQLMMQSGMFVAAESFRADIRDRVFTHFKREEDPAMRGGKLDEELSRMSEIADAITPASMLLCNESFAATNEREGSEIARQVVRPLVEARVKVFIVTHLYDLAHGLSAEGRTDALFLRAERLPDGGRTFRMVEGEPLPTSHGEDSYRRIFGRPSAEIADLSR
jgi:DNA mismatch repair ATPase MutS